MIKKLLAVILTSSLLLVSSTAGFAAGTDVSTGQIVKQIDASTVGTIATTDAVVSAPAGDGTFRAGTSTSGSYVFLQNPSSSSAWSVTITGLTSGNLYFEESDDSTTGIDGNWIAVNGRQTGVVNTVLSYVVTTNGLYRGNVAGNKYMRVRSVGTLTGTPSISIRFSNGSGAIFLNAGLPSSSNTIGNVVSAPFINNTSLLSSATSTTGILINNTPSVLFVVTGTYSATYSFQGSPDNVNWFTIPVYYNGGNNNYVTSGTVNGYYYAAAPTGIQYYRTIVTSYTSGTVNITTTPSGIEDANFRGQSSMYYKPVQEPKDVNRQEVTAYTDGTTITGSTTEALYTLSWTLNGVVQTAASTITVPAAKILRIEGFGVESMQTTTAGTACMKKVHLRELIGGGTITTTSPLLKTRMVNIPAASTATNALDRSLSPFSDGFELPANSSFGISHVETAACVAFDTIHITAFTY